MKLNTKILIANIILSVVIFLLTGVGMYYIVNSTVYEELDHHLLQHKADIVSQVDDQVFSLQELQDLGALGSYEWITITPYEGEVLPNKNSFSTIDTLRNPNQAGGPEAYRRLTTAISVNGQYYTLKIYEEVAAWSRISMTILLSILVGLLIWILLLYLVNQMAFGKILAPFYDTVDSLEAISGPTDLDESFPNSGTHEIDVLNRALNTMMEQIRASFEDQKKFIQNASHELLTPLSIIRQKAEKILANSDKLDQNTVESAGEIHQTAVRLSRLSNALLLISRVENRQYELDEQVNISEVTDEVLKELEDFIGIKNISVDRYLDRDIIVQGNKELIQSGIYNIVQNAVKFSPENSTITVTVNGKPGSEELTVSDEGPGIPDELKDSLFGRFKKGNGRSNELGKKNGTGLGLSLVKSICQLHGFKNTAYNTENGGAEVTIKF